MSHLRRTTAGLGAAALLASPITLLTATPANAAEREFRYAGAKVEYEVDKDDGRFEVELDIDDAKRGTKWRVQLFQDGKRYFNRLRTAPGDGDIEVERSRRDTAGSDVFKLRLHRAGFEPVIKTITLR